MWKLREVEESLGAGTGGVMSLLIEHEASVQPSCTWKITGGWVRFECCGAGATMGRGHAAGHGAVINGLPAERAAPEHRRSRLAHADRNTSAEGEQQLQA